MSSRTQTEIDPELAEMLDKILDKAFADIRKKVLTYVVRREKKIARNVAAATKASSRPPRAPRKPRDSDVPTTSRGKETTHRHKRSSYHRSQSSSGSESN